MSRFDWIKKWFCRSGHWVGVDMGTTGIKLVELNGDQLMDCAITSSFNDIPTTFKGKQAVIALPDSLVITRQFQIEAGLDDREQEEQVLWEAQQHIPYLIEEVSLDFKILGVSQDKPDKIDVILVAARKDQVEERVRVATHLGLKVVAVDVESSVIERIPFSLPDETVAVIDIGAANLTVTVLQNNRAIFTRGDPLLENEIVLQLRRALQFFFSASPDIKLSVLIMMGGGALFVGRMDLIKEQLGIPVFLVNSFSLPPELAPRLILSYGLALPWRFNLMPWREQLRVQQKRQLWSLMSGGFAIAVTIIFILHIIIYFHINNQEKTNLFLQKEISSLVKKMDKLIDET